MKDLQDIIELLLSIQGKEINRFVYMSLVLVVFTAVMTKGTIVDKKDMVNNINDSIIQVVVGGVIGCGILYFFGQNSFLPATGIGVVLAIYILDKYMMNPNFVDKVKLPSKVNESGNPSKEIPNESKPKFEKINKDGNYDILDTLYAYGYISENHYKKVIEDSIFESPDEMVEKLTRMPVITKCDIKEARAIMNLMRLRDREITREEAVKYIIKHDYNQGGN